MVQVRYIIIFVAVALGVTVLLLWIISKLEYRFNPKKKSRYKEYADGKKVHDHVRKSRRRYGVPPLIKGYRPSTTNVTRYVPYNVTGIHEEITALPYQEKIQTTDDPVELQNAASSRVRNKMYRYQEILLREKNEEKLRILNDELYLKIRDTQPQNLETFEHYPGIVFNYPKDSLSFNIRGAGLCFTESRDLLLIIFFRNKLWVDMDLRKPKHKQSEIEIMNDRFALHSEIPDASRKILEDKNVEPIITILADDIIRFQIKEDQLFALIKTETDFKKLLELIQAIFQASYKEHDHGLKVKELECYECGDPFNVEEEFCDKCGAQRPACIVCLLDLDPSEKEEVMKLPCCGIYAHVEHIEQWLSKNRRCPNCQENLLKLLRKKM